MPLEEKTHSARYPRLNIRLSAIEFNAVQLIKELNRFSIELNAVTKCFQSDERILETLYRAGVRIFSDSRVLTGKKIRQFFDKKGITDIKACLLRPPLTGEGEEAVRYFDRFYVSTLEQIVELNLEAEKAGVVREVVLMVETGDFREGFLMEEIPDTMKAARKFSNIRTIGFGTNTTCLNRSVPSQKQITEIVELTERYVGREGVPSPGNSGALYLFIKDKLPAFRGELRIGEAILLGNETVEYRKLDFLRDDAFELETSIIEARRKRYDKIQLIAALGKADIGEGKIFPKIRGLKEIRRSSDHTVLVVERAFEEEVMAVLKKNSFTVRFKPDYFALLHSFASPLVNKNYF